MQAHVPGERPSPLLVLALAAGLLIWSAIAAGLGRSPAQEPAGLVQALARAQASFRQHPEGEDTVIWLGRRTAYLGRYEDAVLIYTSGLRRHPDSFRLLRHRGHRFISLRRFRDALADLERAAGLCAGHPDAVEPDGMPNAAGIPRSTVQGNIWYHLGLARYLLGDFEDAARAWQECAALARNDDAFCAAAYWRYLALRRAGRDAEAARVLEAVRTDMDILENHAYHRLLLVFQGALPAAAARAAAGEGLDAATTRYGLGCLFLLQGRREAAREDWRAAVASGPPAAFGVIAAETDLARTE